MQQRSPGDLVVTILFLALLLVPGALALGGRAGVDVAFIEGVEARHPFIAPAPSGGALATGGWQRDAERQIADAFPLRRQLIVGYDRAMYLGLHDIPSPHVVGGRDGWFFLGDEERWYITGERTLSDAQLTAVAELYRARSDWCRRRKIRYVFLLAPNKSTIYPEYLPSGLTREQPTIADRLVPLLRARGITVADPRAALIAAARTIEVYSKGDTHWNDAGAITAYRAVLDAIRGSHVRDVLPRERRSQTVIEGGDLLRLASLEGLVVNSVTRVAFAHRARGTAVPRYPGDANAGAFEITADTIDDPVLPSVVAFGDSFLDGLRPFLAENFHRTVVLRHRSVTGVQFDPAVIEAERPNVVIQELVERSLVFGNEFAVARGTGVE
jgi:hypothetical protein